MAGTGTGGAVWAGWWRSVAVALAVLGPATGAAQGTRPDTARAAAADTAPLGVARAERPDGLPDRPHSALANVGATGGLILLGAGGAQTLRTPTAWPRTAGGFGRRVADQTGFYVLQTGSQRALSAALGLRGDEAPCVRRGFGPLVGCAVARSVTAVDRRGVRRANVPFLASVGVGTAASVAWRPERQSAGKAWGFVATRVGVGLGGYAAERLLVEWRRGRGARPAGGPER